MKKILLSSMMFFSVLAFAQNQKSSISVNPGKQLSHLPKTNYAAVHPANAASKTANTGGSAWFNVLDFNEMLSPGLQELNAMHLFPDSNIILGFDQSNPAVYAWIHKAGTYMDPSFMAQHTLMDAPLAK